jgi:hypothetical protein
VSSSPTDRRAVPPALLDPEPTADKRVRAARHKRIAGTYPALDAAALQRKYGAGANAKLTRVGVFRAPLGASWAQYRQIRDRAIQTYLKALEAMGYRLIPRRGAIRVDPGVYPALHPATGVALLDQREFRVSVDCSAPTAEPVRIQLDPEDVEPTVLAPRRK